MSRLLNRRGTLWTPQSAAVAPTFVAAGQYLAEASGATADIDAPPGLAANDVVLAVLYKENTNAVTPPTGEGFTELGHQATTGTQDHDSYLFGKVCDASEPASYSFAWSGSVWRAGFAVAFRGCAAAPFEAYNGNTTGSSGQDNTPAVSLTTLGLNRMLVWFAASWDVVRYDLASPQAWPAGFTKPPFEGTQPNTLRLLGSAYAVQAAAGASGTIQAPITNGSGGSFAKTAHLVALAPA